MRSEMPSDMTICRLEVIPSVKDEAQALASFQALSSSQNPEAPEVTTLFG